MIGQPYKGYLISYTINRIVREAVRTRDLFGNWVTSWQTIRTSNGNAFSRPAAPRADP